MRKRFLQLAAFVALSMSTTFAQDITVFNFDGITPTFTGSDQLVTIANPLVDATNGSATVGQLTHTGQYNDKNITVDIDPRIYPTVEMLVYVPTSTTGKATIACFNGGTQLDWYETAAIATPGTWVKITRALTFTTKITSVKIGWNRNNAISATAADNVVLYDNLVFKKTASEYITLFNETFYASWSQWAGWSGRPSTQSGKWFGGINLQTTNDSLVVIQRDWNNNAHDFNLQVKKDSASVIIPNISATGFTNLKLSVDLAWPYSAGENNSFYASTAAQKSPLIQYKIGSGNWMNLTTSPIAQAWATQVFVLTDAQGNPIDGSSPVSVRLFHTPTLTVSYDEIKILGKVPSISTSVANNTATQLNVYPNPASDYIIAKGAQQVKLYNLNGKLVLTANNTERVDISALSKGIYVAKVTIGSETSVSKLTKF